MSGTAYVTAAEIRDKLSADITDVDTVLTDNICTEVIRSATEHENKELIADSDTTGYINFQASDDSDGTSYCSATQLILIKKACLYLCCSYALNFNEVDIKYTRAEGTFMRYDQAWQDGATAAAYKKKYTAVIAMLIEGDIADADTHLGQATQPQAEDFVLTGTTLKEKGYEHIWDE